MIRYILTIDVGIKNLAYCFAVFNTIEPDIFKQINIIKWNILDISIDNVKKENKYNAHIVNLIKGIDKMYSDITSPYILHLDPTLIYPTGIEIYIENQPVKQNPTMKAIATGIHTCFTKKMIDDNKIIIVDFLNASVKTSKPFINILFNQVFNKQNIINICKNSFKTNININSILYKFNKVYSGKLLYEHLQSDIGKMDYKSKKEFSELVITEFIQKMDKNVSNIINISQFISSKKKDDMSDTLLYIIYIITR